MDVILAIVKWQNALVSIDTTIIILKTPQKYLQHNEEVLKLLKNAGMLTMSKKFSYFSETIDNLCHVIAPGTLHVATRTTETIEAL